MVPQFKGKLDLDIRDSKPDWTPYEAVKAPSDAPNVLYIVWDDVGFGAFDCFGGPIETPTMSRIASMGLRYTQFHTTALCSPTRSCLLTGRNATSNNMAVITEVTSGFPGFSGHIPPENGFISEILVEKGWNTYAVGKWHVTPDEECNMASTRRSWPLNKGFERFYGFLGGETNQWYPTLIEDNHPVEQPYLPKEGYHLSKDLTDKAITFIQDAKSIIPDKPWMLYFCPGAGHAPHHAPKEWTEKYKGKFDTGYEKIRETILNNQKKMGLVPPNTELPAINPYAQAKSADGKSWPELDMVRPWVSLSNDERKLFSRMAEVYAGFISYTDDQIGRLLTYLEKSGQLDNTLIVVVSDNGASGEGGPNGSVNENKFFNGIADNLQQNLSMLEDLGSEKTYNHYCTGWAMAFNTPFKMWKRYSGNEGGIADPCLVSWPKSIKARGQVRHQYIHAVDIIPTILDCLQIDAPDSVKGNSQSPFEGASFKDSLNNSEAPDPRETQFFTMLGTRGVRYKQWFANTIHPAISGWSHFEKDIWELYNIKEDRNQMKNVADKYPDILEKMKNIWFLQAGKFKGLPLDDRTALEIMSSPRPQLTKPRTNFIYFPGSVIPESVAVDFRGRSYNIAAQVNINNVEPRGILFAHGGRFGGHVLFIKDMKLQYVYNWLGEKEQVVTANVNLHKGKSILGLRFELTGKEGVSPAGTASLYYDDKKVGEARIITQPGRFGLSGCGLEVGRNSGQSISSLYDAPFQFKGGIIEQVNVDVSGEPYQDLERELMGMLMRD